MIVNYKDEENREWTLHQMVRDVVSVGKRVDDEEVLKRWAVLKEEQALVLDDNRSLNEVMELRKLFYKRFPEVTVRTLIKPNGKYRTYVLEEEDRGLTMEVK